MKYIIYLTCILSFFTGFSQEKIEKLQDLTGKNLKVGLVLSGGGAKGLAHIAALEAIEKAGVRIDYIGGTSMGAIVGGLYAIGYKAHQLDSIFQKIDFEKLIQDDVSRSSQTFYEKENRDRYMLSLPFNKGKIGVPVSFTKGNNLYNLLAQLTYPARHIDDFSQFPIPFLCIATDIEKGQEVILESGDLAHAIMASGSFPTLFSPVEIDGQLLTDGGVLNNYPIDEVRAKGVDVIIGVDIQAPLHKRDKLNSAMGILLQITSFKIANDMTEKQTKTDIYIKPNMANYNVISFAEGQAIIDSGRVAVAKEYSKLEALAKKQIPRVLPPIQLTDSLHITDITFSGNDHFSNAYLRGKLRFKWGETISFNNLKEGVQNLIATQNFQSIRYQICSNEQGDDINFRLIENPYRTHLKMALHYDNLFKSGILFNFTKRGFFQGDNILSVDFVAGDNIRYKVDYYVDKGFYTSYGLRSVLNQFTREVSYEQFRQASGVNLNEVAKINAQTLDMNNQIYIQSIFREKFLIGLGLEHRYIRYRTNTLQDNQLFENTHFASSYGYIRYDSFDDKLVPTTGFYFDADAHWYLLSWGMKEKQNPFILTKAMVGGAIPITSRLSSRLMFSSGFNIGNPDTSSLAFILGGYGENLFGNLIPFVGYDYLSFGGYNFLKAEAVFNYRFYKKNYINFTANYANLSNEFFYLNNWISLPRYSGYALGITSRTIIGPIEIKYSYSPEIKRSLWFLNLGFWF